MLIRETLEVRRENLTFHNLTPYALHLPLQTKLRQPYDLPAFLCRFVR